MEVHLRASGPLKAAFELPHETRTQSLMATGWVDREVMDPSAPTIEPAQHDADDPAVLGRHKEEPRIPPPRPLDLGPGV